MSGPVDSPADKTAERPGTLDVGQLIDVRPISRFQLVAAIICGAIVFLGGFDAQIMDYVAPALHRDLNIAQPALGQVLSSGLVGMMIGALAFGPIADRFGRRPVLIVCPLIFGVGALLTATADSVTSLLLYRLLTGLGMGGAMPNTIALTAEYMPKRSRASAVMIMFCGFSIGAAVVGWVAAGLIPLFGWRSVFVVGGVLPIAITVVTFLFLPESIRFLLRRQRDQHRAHGYLSRIAPDAPRTARLVVTDEATHGGGNMFKQLFVDGRYRVTLLLWVMFFANLLDLYFIASWLPTIVKGAGIPEGRAIMISTLLQIGGLVGAIVLGRVLDRYLSFRLLAAAYLTAAVWVFLIGESGTSSAWLIVTVFAAGFGVIGAQFAANAIAAEIYPTASRSTGVGWAFGVGRIGSILGPTLGGALVGTTPRLFLLAAVPPLVASIAAFAASTMHRKDGP
jgi:MFS transporter, AAHS family, 4-hydroxybenzoate transporter